MKQIITITRNSPASDLGPEYLHWHTIAQRRARSSYDSSGPFEIRRSLEGNVPVEGFRFEGLGYGAKVSGLRLVLRA